MKVLTARTKEPGEREKRDRLRAASQQLIENKISGVDVYSRVPGMLATECACRIKGSVVRSYNALIKERIIKSRVKNYRPYLK
jgi:hypothetical protein